MNRLPLTLATLTASAWLATACATRPAATNDVAVEYNEPAAIAAATESDAVFAAPVAQPTTQPALLSAAAAGEPATQPANLPKGHPDIAEMLKARQNRAGQPQSPTGMGGAAPANGALPAGHPPIGGSNPAPMGGGNSGALPSGHPDISSMMGNRTAQPTTKPAAAGTMGSLTVKAVQGTAGGPAVGADAVTVTVYDAGKAVSKVEGNLDGNGAVTVKGLPVGPAVQPVVKVVHAGVEYEATGAVVDGSEQQLEVKVYETTEAEPAWQVRMRHLITRPTTAGVEVMEVISIDNPTDRAWVGTPGPDGKRTTFALPLPAGAEQVQLLGGFHDCCVKTDGGTITNTMALLPGTVQYQLGYVVPVKDGKAELTSTSPAPVKHLMIFVPEDGSTVAPDGLEAGTANMGNGDTRFYKAAALPADRQVKLTISNITTAPEAKTATAGASGAATGAAGMVSSMNTADMAKAVAGVGALVIFLFGGAALLMKPGGKGKQLATAKA